MTTLWYLWKARNDLRFQRKKWFVFQVHHAVEADIKTSTIDNQGKLQQPKGITNCRENRDSSLLFAGLQLDQQTPGASQSTRDGALNPSNVNAGYAFSCRLPGAVPGPRCYSDASIAPDGTTQDTRTAGLGVFYLDPDRNHRFYIKAKVDQMNSVLMAEAAAINLAAKIGTLFALREISFFTDNQQMATFFNGASHVLPPRWDIKPYTQRFLNLTEGYSWKVLKVHRDLNKTAHILASQAFRASMSSTTNIQISCTNEEHVQSCPLREALNAVSWENFFLVAASCC